MRVQYHLDTNILSEPLKPAPDPRVTDWLQQHHGEVATASPVWHELLFGCERLPESARRETLKTYLSEVLEPSLPVLPYDREAAGWHAAERARLTGEGRTPAFVDGQIAAVAAVKRLSMVTLIPAHFKPFQGLEVEELGRS